VNIVNASTVGANVALVGAIFGVHFMIRIIVSKIGSGMTFTHLQFYGLGFGEVATDMASLEITISLSGR
jgi:hypothetical protein